MTKHKKQHSIPQCYLRSWCDHKCPSGLTPYVWRFLKNGSTAKKKAPKNIFYETDMYTIYLEDGSRNLVLEHGLNQLETLFAKLRDKKIQKKVVLNLEDRVVLCAFIAAMFARTKAQREHQRKQWTEPLKMMESMIEQMKNSTPEEKMQMVSPASLNAGPSFSYEDVKKIVKAPLQTFLPSTVRTMTPLLSKLDLAIFTTNDNIGFITSDAPCVWFDPEAYKRPPMMRSPALMYKTTEIILPISPSETLCLNQHGINGYFEASDKLMDEFNTRVRFCAEEYFIVNSNFKKDVWFDPGTDPEDSWEKVQERKIKNST